MCEQADRRLGMKYWRFIKRVWSLNDCYLCDHFSSRRHTWLNGSGRREPGRFRRPVAAPASIFKTFMQRLLTADRILDQV